MTIDIAGIPIYYEQNRGAGIPVVLLHGWGGSTVSFAGVFRFLVAEGRNVAVLDFPGFGKSGQPPADWGIYDYARVTAGFIEALGYERAVLVGHSFGGRVAVILGKLPMCAGLVLTDSAGMKPRRGLKYAVKVSLYKAGKKLGLKPRGGSADYKALPEGMRGIFVRVVNTHLEGELKSISCPTLIVWGENDRDTPPYMAKRLNRGIRDSAVVMLRGGHYSYLDDAARYHAVLRAFIEEVSA